MKRISSPKVLIWSFDSGVQSLDGQPATVTRFHRKPETRSLSNKTMLIERPPAQTQLSHVREFIRRTIHAGNLLHYLRQQIVHQRTRPETESLGRQPLLAQRLIHHNQILDRLLRGANPAGRL